MTPRETAKKQMALVESTLTFEQMKERADLLVKSGFLPKSIKTAEQAIAIMLLGAEYQISPMKSFQSICVIEGKPTLSASLMLALCERTGQLEDKVIEIHDTYAKVTLTRKGQTPHSAIFGDADAKTMRTKEAQYDAQGKWIGSRVIALIDKYNYVTMRKDMYVARATSRACRRVFPDAVLGLLVEEEAFDIIDATAEAKIEAQGLLSTATETASEALPASTPGDVHSNGVEIELINRIGGGFIQCPNLGKMYQDRSIYEIFVDKTQGGDPKGLKFLRKLAAESSVPEERAQISKYLDFMEKELVK